MKDISAAAELGPGTLYRNYPNKGALCLDLVYDHLQAFISHQKKLTPTTSTWPVLLTNYLNFREENRGLLGTIENSSQIDFTQTPLYHELSQLFSPFLQAILPNATTTTIQFRTDMLIAMLKSDSYAFQRKQRGLSNAQISQMLNAILRSPL
ncbi:TetR/AcrR family transcriptional regulator [Levilactobacillus huananensis]|uniref:TetR/AcrR family transcriptional regulator n=1 Tax=Levilactobacillus huananensis TaxID=2486019 RepID=UPI0021F06DB4|nr:TetR/AcrR family transcriptional regulator [Levilactobacillus huananensis]